MRPVEASHGALLSGVINLDGVVPPTRDEDLRDNRVELNTENPVGVPWQVTLLFKVKEK